MSTTNMTVASTLLYIQQQIARYVYSMYCIFGVTGCCLNILLLSRRQFRTVSCCTYFIVASITMLINLTLGIFTVMYPLNHVDPGVTVPAYCKMRSYFLQSSSMMFRWCLTVACFDRFALSCANARLRTFATVRVARRVVAIIVPLWLVLPVHNLVFYQLKGGNCGILASYAEALYHSLFTTITGSVLPVSFMITCTILIRRNLVQKRQRRLHNVIQVPRETNQIVDVQQKRDQQVLRMLIIQVIVYATLITPLMGFYFYSAVSLGIPNKTPDRLAIEGFALFMAQTIIFLFPSLSFYLYTLVSRTFREELVKILRSSKIFRCLVSNARVEPTVTASTGQRNTGNQLPRQVVS